MIYFMIFSFNKSTGTRFKIMLILNLGITIKVGTQVNLVPYVQNVWLSIELLGLSYAS